MNLKRFKNGFHKPWSVQRTKWWIIIILTAIFGRRMKIEGASKSHRILPLIWNKKLYLLGLQHECVNVSFDRLYRAVMTSSPIVKPHHPKGKKINHSSPGRFLHVTALHYKAEEADALLEAWAEMALDEGDIILAYGGSHQEYEKIRYEPKFFVPQSAIWFVEKGGPMSKTHMIREAARYMVQGNYSAMIYTDGDAWPCTYGYLGKLCLPPWKEGVDFTTPRLRDITHANLIYQGWSKHTRPSLEKWVLNHRLSDPNGPIRILQGFTAFFYLSRELAGRFLEFCCDEPPIHNETALPTYMLHLGASYQSYEDFGIYDVCKWVRFRPNMSHSEYLDAMKNKLPLIHPVKNNQWITANTIT